MRETKLVRPNETSPQLLLSLCSLLACTLVSADDETTGSAATTAAPTESTGSEPLPTTSGEASTGPDDADTSGDTFSSSGDVDTLADSTSGGEPDVPTVLWVQDFEDGPGDWSVEGGIWEIGAPTAPDGPSAFGGNAVAGTVLAGDYPGGTQDARLVSPHIAVLDDATPMRVRFQRWVDLGSADRGTVQIRVVGGEWSDVEETVQLGRTGGWGQTLLELDAFAGETVELAFHFTAAGASNFNLGWYVDDVVLESGALPAGFASSFEDGAGDWSALGALWAVGEPTAAEGPQPHGGNNVLGTTLDGEYPGGSINTLLITPPIFVAHDDANPRLRVWHWFDLGSSDRGSVFVREVGGDWDERNELEVMNSSNGWSQMFVPLADHAGSWVQVGFRMIAEGASNFEQGWYFDDIEYVPD